MELDVGFFSRLVVQPVVVISTVSPNGVSNAAPISFNAPATTGPPPLYGFCCETKHDTWRNIRENGEFVVNMVGKEFAPIMDELASDLPYEESEIAHCGLTEEEASTVSPPRIAEAYGWLECRMREHVELSERAVWIIGEVTAVAVKEDAFDEILKLEKVNPLHLVTAGGYVADMRRITKT